jgi:hypothetical protein
VTTKQRNLQEFYRRRSPAPGQSNQEKKQMFLVTAWALACAGILLFGAAFVAGSAGIALAEIVSVMFSYVLVSAGLLFTMYKMRY